MPVDSKHPDYQARAAEWAQVRACYEGQNAIKAAGTTYLPKLRVGQTDAEYAQYRARAYFYGILGRTVQELTGAAAGKDLTVEAPGEDLAALADREMFRALVRELMLAGRYGLLVEMPVEGQAGQSPYIVGRSAESIVNWRIRDGRPVMIMLAEMVEVQGEDGYAQTKEPRWRELFLDEGKYKVRIWKKVKKTPTGKEDFVIEEESSPPGRGGRWTSSPLWPPTRTGSVGAWSRARCWS